MNREKQNEKKIMTKTTQFWNEKEIRNDIFLCHFFLTIHSLIVISFQEIRQIKYNCSCTGNGHNLSDFSINEWMNKMYANNKPNHKQNRQIGIVVHRDKESWSQTETNTNG